VNKEEIATRIVRTLHDKGFDAYFAGGCVRDKLRGVPPKDFDIATSARPEDVQKIFPRTVPVGVQFGVVLVVDEGEHFEVATFRTEGGYQDGRHPTQVDFSNVEEDARRRDFTVNGLYYDIKTKKFLDFVGGEADLKKKILTTIGDPEARFLEDHLRMLRAVRFAVQLGFEIAPATIAAIRKHAPKISKVSVERIREEFCKILTSPEPARGVRQLDELGLLKEFLPEVEVMKGVEQPMEYHPEGDVFIHTMMLLDGLKNAPIELAMGCLLHDIAKPATFERAPDRIRFHGHDKLGAEMSEVICRRLTFPNEQTKLICELVAHHLRFKDVAQMRVATMKRFLRMPRFDLHLELHRLDCMASHKKLDAYELSKKKLEELAKEPPAPSRILTGADLILLGYRPGKELGEVLREVEDAVLEGRVTSKEDAIEFVKKLGNES